MLIIVAFLVVNFFTKMVIARNPGGIQIPGSLQMNPTAPPELFQPSRDLNNRQEVEQKLQSWIKKTKSKNNPHDYLLLSVSSNMDVYPVRISLRRIWICGPKWRGRGSIGENWEKTEVIKFQKFHFSHRPCGSCLIFICAHSHLPLPNLRFFTISHTMTFS